LRKTPADRPAVLVKGHVLDGGVFGQVLKGGGYGGIPLGDANSDEWRALELNVPVPAEAGGIYLILQTASPGTLYVDDVSVEELDGQ